MEISNNLALFSLLGAISCFAVAFVTAVIEVRRGSSHHRAITMTLMGVGFLLETVYLQYQGNVRGRCPITTLPEIMIFLSWSTVLIYFVIGSTYRLSLLGVFTAPVVGLFVVLGLVGGGVGGGIPVASRPADAWLEFHASVSLVSYGAFALALVAGVMFLVQDSLLKSKSMTALFYNLPPISYLASAISRLVLVGFVLLSAGLASAFAIREFPGWTKISLTLSVWIVYGLILLVHGRSHLAPKQIAKVSVLAFLLPLLTLTIMGAR